MVEEVASHWQVDTVSLYGSDDNNCNIRFADEFYQFISGKLIHPERLS